MPSQVNDCCGSPAHVWDGIGTPASRCDDCCNDVCEACAAVYEVDGGYGEG